MRKILALTLGATVLLMMGYVEGTEYLKQDQLEHAQKRLPGESVRKSTPRKKIVSPGGSGLTTPRPAPKNALLLREKGCPVSVVPFPPPSQTREQKELEVDRECRGVLNALYNAGGSINQAAQSILDLAGRGAVLAQRCVEAACGRPFADVNPKDPQTIAAIARYIRPAKADKSAVTLCTSVEDLYLFTRSAAALANDLEKKIEEVAKAWGAFKAALFEGRQYNLVVGSYYYNVVGTMIKKLSETSLSLEVLPIKEGAKQQLCELLASCLMTFDCSIKSG